MDALRVKEPWRAAGGPAFALYLVTVAAGLFRVADQPSLEVGAGGTDVSLVPTDLAFAALAAVTLARLVRGPLPAGPGRVVLVAAAAFAAWLGLSAVPNGGTAIVAAGRLLELAVLALATAVLVERRGQLRLLAGTLLVMTLAAVAVAFLGFLGDPGGRQASFMGEHDLAALSSLAAAGGVAAFFARARPGLVAVLAVLAGALGIVLGAALASLLGLYLAIGGVLAVAAVRRSLRARALLAAALVLAGVTAGTLSMRSGDLGFLQVLAGREEEEPGQFAASWSQRLVYAYVGLRVFRDQPVTGTGWYPLLPPEEFARYLPDARERFDNQPPHYFPPADSGFIPQQTPDQVLYELGLVGAALFLLLAGAIVRAAWRAARRFAREADDLPAYLPAAAAGAMAGALAGSALFGGTPIAALFWLTVGLAAAVPALRPGGASLRTAA